MELPVRGGRSYSTHFLKCCGSGYSIMGSSGEVSVRFGSGEAVEGVVEITSSSSKRSRGSSGGFKVEDVRGTEGSVEVDIERRLLPHLLLAFDRQSRMMQTARKVSGMTVRHFNFTSGMMDR